MERPEINKNKTNQKSSNKNGLGEMEGKKERYSGGEWEGVCKRDENVCVCEGGGLRDGGGGGGAASTQKSSFFAQMTS